MTPEREVPADGDSGPSQLHTTAWSMVLGAGKPGPAQQACLERLIRAYWKPAYFYARRRGMDHHAASDAVQDFFTRMLAGEWLSSVDPKRGRFRGWLLTALRRWISRTSAATGMARLTLVSDDVVRAYEETSAAGNPEDLFNRAWARSCLDEALRLMETEQGGETRRRQLAVFKAFLEAAGEDRSPSYEDLALRFCVPVTTVTNDLHRARALFRTYLQRAIRETVGSSEDLEQEMHELRRFLGT